MSEHNIAEYPLFSVLIGLYVFSVSLIVLAGSSGTVIGLLLVLWGFFALLRCLWVMEFMRKSKAQSSRKYSLLPWKILNSMQRRQHVDKVRKSLLVFNKSIFIWFTLMGLYVLAACYDLFPPTVSAEQYQAQALIEIFMEAKNLQISFWPQPVFIKIGGLIIVGLSFFAVQTYAHIKNNIKPLLWMFVTVFALAHIPFLYTQSIDKSEIVFGPGKVFLYLAFAHAALIFIRAIMRNKGQTLYVLIALATLCIMAADYFFMRNSLAVWLSGWVIIALLWARLSAGISAKYVLYQT